MSVVLLLSGGLDSVTLLARLRRVGNDVRCLYYDYGQPARKQEERLAALAARQSGAMFVSDTLPQLPFEGVVYPIRNAVMLSAACSYAEGVKAETVYYGAIKNDYERFTDCRPEFVEAFNQMLIAYGSSVRVDAPFIGMEKSEVVSLAKQLGVDIHATWSCYGSRSIECGECLSCAEKKAALA